MDRIGNRMEQRHRAKKNWKRTETDTSEQTQMNGVRKLQN